MITRLVGGLFLLKGLFGLITALKFFDDVYPVSIGANIWDFFIMLITEISPTLVFIFLAKRGSKYVSETPDPDDREDKEMEIRTVDYKDFND